MTCSQFDKDLQSAYASCARQYRASDEIEIQTIHHRRRRRQLRRLSGSFGRDITVLDAGCGSGRYFHCLTNVSKLVALDLSPEMLALARSPVRADAVATGNIDYVCGSIYSAKFDPGSFDLIYLLGVFGYACPLTDHLLGRFWTWLADEGVLYFDVRDASQLSLRERVHQGAHNIMRTRLPISMQQWLRLERFGLPVFSLSRRGLERQMKRTPFRTVNVERVDLQASWLDVKLECVARKETRLRGR